MINRYVVTEVNTHVTLTWMVAEETDVLCYQPIVLNISGYSFIQPSINYHMMSHDVMLPHHYHRHSETQSC